MVIFKYITEKDVFQKFYRNLLASRLVNDTSVSHDLEGSMISKLKVLNSLFSLHKLHLLINLPDCTNFYVVQTRMRIWSLVVIPEIIVVLTKHCLPQTARVRL